MNSLNATAKTKGLLFGSAAAVPQVIPGSATYDMAYTGLILQHCGIITTDIGMKWPDIWPTPDMTPNWSQADALVGWAMSNGLLVKGHNLIWNEYNPSWLWSDNTTAPNYGTLNVTPAQAMYAFDQSITQTVGRYAHQVRIWDVVNEPIEPAHGQPDGMRTKTWWTVFGPKYVERALLRAHAADPSAKLFINQQGLEAMANEPHRVFFLQLIDRLLNAGIPLNGVGFESHLVLWQEVTHEGVMWLLGELQKRKLEVHISELDVQHAGNSGWALPAGTAESVVDPVVAQRVGNYLADVLSFSNVTAIICWELSDKYGWANSWAPYGWPFDVNMQPKPFATAIQQAILNR